ncbi:vacuolar protein sorting-associated protein vps17 [Coprinopsis marcescibilis]|uniref:Vacuolar protein sorting-associated protein vps17 n=1 Tax=Coprinopsis marcescibilis TaxID=230819 RepID=A0A5C3L7Y4_COPMA|nr:vacuolar protein sorting-associated protein vps17 [Coprinopsis marcescibilis]
MFDPLSPSNSGFADLDGPAWPTTPHPPGTLVPNLRPAGSPVPHTPDNGPAPGLYGKEPQIYGQPDSGLISPRETVSSNGTSFEKQDPYLKVRITGLDRNRRDILIKFDAQTNLTNFTGTTYRNVSRSYLEFQQFYEAIVPSNPQTIIPALPLAQTSAPTDEEDDRLVKIMLQRWFTRVCEDPILLGDEDLRSFIESDFGYQPTPRPKRKTSSGFTLIRRNVPDEDEELQKARFELTKLEGQFFDTAKAVDRLAITRKGLAAAHAAMGDKLISVASTEAHPPLGNAFRKLGRTWHSLADLDHAQAISECVILGDSLGYQGMNARSAKETLQMRTGVLEEYQAAVKTTISKRRQIERLKASSNIRPERVDDALEDMEEANKYEQILARRAEGISQNLHMALDTHNRHANDDITTALIEHARSSILYERQFLRDLESLRTDVGNANKKVLPNVVVPRPKIIPPLEDFVDRPSLPSAPVRNGHHPGPSIDTPPHTAAPSTASSSRLPQAIPNQDIRPSSVPPQPSKPAVRAPPLAAAQSASPLAAPVARQPLGSGVEAPPKENTREAPRSTDTPPLGGKFVDGSKSMFITPTSTRPATFHTPSMTNVAKGPIDPLRRSYEAPTSPLESGPAPSGGANQSFDPLGQIKTRQLSSSVRVQPQRPRLDPREAASKLANMF